MMNVIPIMSLLLIGQVGPIDAFNANESAIRAEVDYIYTTSVGDAATINARTDYYFHGVSIGWEPITDVRGRWVCDGIAQRYAMDLVGYDHRTYKMSNGFEIRPCEVMFDRELMAFYDHTLPGQAIQVLENARSPLFLVGPLAWWFDTMPAIIQADFSESKVRSSRMIRGGIPVEVEIREAMMQEGWYRLEISFDPAVGFLPRFARMISTDAGGKASIKQFYLTDAKPCGAGGFVPLEWSSVEFHVAGFSKKFPGYDEKTDIPASGKVLLRHYLAESFRDLKGPVKFEEVPRAEDIMAKGGFVARKALPRELTLDAFRTGLGKKLKVVSAIPLANIDSKEQHETFNPRPRWGWLAYLAAGLLVAVAAVAYRARRCALIALLMGPIWLSGCSETPKPPAHLSAAMNSAIILHDIKSPLPQGLKITNGGGRTIRVFDVSGGCTCRKVDDSRWPKDIPPGESVETSLLLKSLRDYGPQHIILEFTTDQGKLAVPMDFVAFPRHNLQPDSLSASVIGEGSTFEPMDVVHREVYAEGSSPQPVALRSLPGVDIEKLEVKTGEVGFVRGYRYADTTYRVRVLGDDIGMNKSVVTFIELGDKLLFDLPVVWNRFPFLSAVPARVTLGARPIRVFFRCPDHAVELTKILSAPPGIKAVVSSTREVTISLADDAPGVIDGVVEVGTTAGGRPPLRIPVVRYAPLAAR